jgi:hypothetical protein
MMLLQLVTEPLQFRTLLFQGDKLLDPDLRLQNIFISNFLNFLDELLMPLLVLLQQFLLIYHRVLLVLVGILVKIVQRGFGIDHNRLIEYFLDEFVQEILLREVNRCKNLLNFLVVRLRGISIESLQDVLLLWLVEHLENWINVLEGTDRLARELL